MLRARRRFRNGELFLEPGEYIEFDPETEAWLQRCSPDSFEVVDPKAKRKGIPAPPRDKMLRREREVRDKSERVPQSGRAGGEAMTRANTPGLVPKRPGE